MTMRCVQRHDHGLGQFDVMLAFHPSVDKGLPFNDARVVGWKLSGCENQTWSELQGSPHGVAHHDHDIFSTGLHSILGR